MNAAELELYCASKAGDMCKVEAMLTSNFLIHLDKQNSGDVRVRRIREAA